MHKTQVYVFSGKFRDRDEVCGKWCYVLIKYAWAVYIYLALPTALVWLLVLVFQSNWPLFIFTVTVPWAAKRRILSNNLLAK